MKAVKALDGTTIPLHCIDRVYIKTEKCVNDAEAGGLNTWELMIQTTSLYGSVVYTIFEAEGFDNPNEMFYSMDAVQGKNYKVVNKISIKLINAIEEEKAEFEFV